MYVVLRCVCVSRVMQYVVVVSILCVAISLSLPLPPYAVGKTGQHMLIECGTDLEGAKQHFTKKYVLM